MGKHINSHLPIISDSNCNWLKEGLLTLVFYTNDSMELIPFNLTILINSKEIEIL